MSTWKNTTLYAYIDANVSLINQKPDEPTFFSGPIPQRRTVQQKLGAGYPAEKKDTQAIQKQYSAYRKKGRVNEGLWCNRFLLRDHGYDLNDVSIGGLGNRTSRDSCLAIRTGNKNQTKLPNPTSYPSSTSKVRHRPHTIYITPDQIRSTAKAINDIKAFTGFRLDAFGTLTIPLKETISDDSVDIEHGNY